MGDKKRRQLFLNEAVTRLQLLANEWEANRALLEETGRKRESTLRTPRIMEQPRHYGSSARYIHDPMTPGLPTWGRL